MTLKDFILHMSKDGEQSSRLADERTRLSA
jgi:hypothetical protein